MKNTVKNDRTRTFDLKPTHSFDCVVIAVIALLILFIAALPAQAVTLRANNVVKTNTITVSDIFDGAGDKGQRVLGPAPVPGKDMVLNARTLMRIALALDLNWRPAHSAETATLKRAATIISHDEVSDNLRTALTQKGVDGLFNIQLDSGTNTIALPDGTQTSMDIDNLSFNHKTNRFDAHIYAPSQDNPIYNTRISGTIERLIEIPVLTNSIRNGGIIGTRDINYIEVSERALSSNVLIDANELIGMTPRRTLTQGTPIKVSDLVKPEAVSRGSLVTVIFKSGPLLLTAEGKALQNGAQGDNIRVINTASNKTLQGRVTNTNEVLVEAF